MHLTRDKLGAGFEAASAVALMARRLPTQDSRCAFTPYKFPAATFDQIAPFIHNGGRLQYCGPWFNPVSTVIRWKEYGPWSHSALAGVQDSEPTVIDICAKTGCTEHSLEAAVKKAPGRWYYSPIDPRFLSGPSKFDPDAAVKAARADIGMLYGKRGIVLQMATGTPLINGLAWTLQMQNWPYFADATSFCSQGVKRWCADGGGLDPVPHTQSNLCTPLNIGQALLWLPYFVAIYPNDWSGP